MEATKEIKIILYILVVMVGMQMGFTFNKLNMMEDKIEAITMESDSTLTENERRWIRSFPEVGEVGFPVNLNK